MSLMYQSPYPHPDYLYRYRAFNKYSISELVTGRQWFSTLENFNDPFETFIDRFHIKAAVDDPGKPGQFRQIDDPRLMGIYHALKEGLKGFGILCFSAKNDNHLMWSHYADQHKGFCIGYRCDKPLIMWQHTRPVQYSTEYVELLNDISRYLEKAYKAGKVTMADVKPVIDKIIYTKSHHWAYEDEWRLIDANSGKGAKKIPPRISKIIFGFRMPNQDREVVWQLTKDIPGVRFYHSNGHIEPDWRMSIVKDDPHYL